MIGDVAIAVARVLIALLYILMAYRQIRFWPHVQKEMAAHGMRHTELFLPLAVAVEILGGLSLGLGYAAAWGAWLLIAYTLVATAIFYRRLSDRDEFIHCLKNLAIVGGLLMIAATDPAAARVNAAAVAPAGQTTAK